MEEVADLVLGKVTQEMNEQLTKKFQKEEIIQVVQNMHPKKPWALTVCLLSFTKNIGMSLEMMKYYAKCSKLKCISSSPKPS